MPRSVNQKKKLAVLRDIFLERTDSLHPITMKELISALHAAGISAERKSIYNDIAILRELGVDIKVLRGKTTGYYVASREFELPELKLLADAIRASKFITEKKSSQLIKKLANLANCHDRSSLNREVFVSNRVKSMNEEIYLTVDRIHEAIENDRRISFGYFQWTPEKKKELRRGGERYEVSPWALVWDDSNYYLIGFDHSHKGIRHYRVDKTVSVKLCDTKREGRAEFEKFDLRSYSGAVFGMFGGKPERVALSCANRLANVMIDRFGRDTVILKESEERFRIHVNVVPSPVFLGWVISFGGEVTVVSPEGVAENMKQLALSIAENNNK